MVGNMLDHHRRFLVSFERGELDWDRLGLARIDRLPAIKWRQQNLDTISETKRLDLVAQLERVLGIVAT
jgi:hypothetical protein